MSDSEFATTTQNLGPPKAGGAKQRMLLVLDADAPRVVILPDRTEVTIGRGEDVDVCIDEPSLSRAHARLAFGAHITLEDLSSSNGTFVGGVRIAPSRPVLVRPGMPIQLGRVMAVVHVGPEPQPTLVSSDGTSSSTQAFERIVERIAGSPLAVLLIGETGVGKGTLARRIHDGSSRAAGPYVVVGAAAATDLAARDLMASARGGTLVLDEICDVAPAAQPALLVAIDALAGDARLIATSRRDTADARDPQRLIPELHYRVAGITIVIPPLRARVPEIAELALRIGAEAARELGRPPPVLAPDALAALEHHKWPGNVRELSACITRALALSPGRVLTASHFDLERPDVSAIGMPMVVSSGERARGGALRGAREGAEYERIIEALRASNGNQTHAAKLLGISRGTLLSRLERYHVPRPRKPSRP